ncbi:MAG: hypothetical protein PHY14_00495 [Candidatus Gracilibacteria bacterium]|nr:hypothetical protein [Candidatus Gracilibacteria bacterium]
MKVLNRINDARIKSLNVMLELSIKEYYDLSTSILDNNIFQRGKVKSSSVVYSLLKSDLKTGCIIPPIVLSLSARINENISDDDLIKYIKENKNKLSILDGLQRTFVIKDLVNETQEDDTGFLFNNKVRIEVYVGIEKLGILYRMLTLNTGQTQMSVRHQIEIIYSNYIEEGLDDIGVKLIREIDDETPRLLGEYKFRDVIEGFSAYLRRNYLTLDREDLLEIIESLEKLSKEQENIDLFKMFLISYHGFVKFIFDNSNNWQFDDKYLTLNGRPFSVNALNMFNKSQTMTGFGAAIGKLIDNASISNIDDIQRMINKIDLGNIDNNLYDLLKQFDYIQTTAKKIGNDQRMFFYYLFRALFNVDSDGYLSLEKSIQEAKLQYSRNV